MAARQDSPLVDAILEYRAAKAAIALMNGDEAAKKRLSEHPGLINLIDEMYRAQMGK